MSVNQLVQELKENQEDYEFYPTSLEMVEPIYYSIQQHFGHKLSGIKVLDIGCGTCNFKKHFNTLRNQSNKGAEIGDYFAIEKSRTLISKLLGSNVTIIGTDFNSTLLMDKQADVYFCNPPYSEFKQWTKRIISEGNFKTAYLIIPTRWKEDKDIQDTIKISDVDVKVIGSFDFLNADRVARAKVDVLEVVNESTYRDSNEVRQSAFDKWFTDTFKSGKENSTASEMEQYKEENISNSLVNCKTKASMLLEYYSAELNRLFKSFKAITQLDEETLKDIGVDTSKVKRAILEKSKGLKIKYWQLALNQLEEITDRLTTHSRREVFKSFKALVNVDFTMENIWMVTMWVLQHSKEYYDKQLLAFYDNLTSPDNIEKYKSNQKVFRRSEYRPEWFANKEEVSHYTLNYRIITQKSCDTNFYNELNEENNGFKSYNSGVSAYIHDIITVAKNLGFIASRTFEPPKNWGTKNYVYYENDCKKPFMEYKVYKNGNVHIKFDIEFMKALNVEAGRLLGWLTSPEQAKEEFTDVMAKGIEKYFKSQYDCLSVNNQLLLGTLQ